MMMLPDDPVLKGRLFRAARVLLRWNQAHLAARAGLSASTVNAVENARHSAATASAKLVALALEAAGIRFLGVADGLGHGLRYGGTGQHRPANTVVRFGQPHRPSALGRASSGQRASGDGGSSARGKGTAAAALLVERQRVLVDRLRAGGHDCGPAVALLLELERTRRLIDRSRMLTGAPMTVREYVPRHRPDLAA
jgi:transcriptional regulator with XRE-family HTH domain